MNTKTAPPRTGERHGIVPGRQYAERVNAQRKDEFCVRMVRVKGAAKVMARLMFGVPALVADQMLRMVQ